MSGAEWWIAATGFVWGMVVAFGIAWVLVWWKR